ncbi:MAG TPA: RNA polymerase sigma factor [Vicinamibacterales bacterium]|nr:RNA polymerase sigma factor [Vicinamibacterales bacterium]
MSDPTDLDLVERYRRFGDRAAFDQLAERHHRWVRSVCARILRSDDRADDAAQDVFARALAAIGSWRGDNFPGWLKAIAVNCSLTIVDREKRWAPLEHAPDAPDGRRDPEQLLIAEHQSARARSLIAQLPDKQRLVFVLKYIDGCSYDDIERLTGFTSGEVKSYIQNARRNFSNWWEAGRQ